MAAAILTALTAKAGPTFNQDVAPILHRNCAECHRPGQAAPFSLLTYEDARKHAKQIAEVTGTRFMPPWLPEHGFGEFVGERRLEAKEIQTLKEWAEQGAPEGADTTAPALPQWSGDWRLGTPDLIVQMPAPFNVPAEGKDLYRNFVFPIPLASNRFVRGFELRPGNPRVLHHAFIYTDETRRSRHLAEKQGSIDGMEVPESAIMPPGQLLSWQPGKAPSFFSPGLSWPLRTNTDAILQLHLHPSGKAETIQPAIGLYFTDAPPSKPSFRIILRRMDFRLPAGETNVVIEQAYRLPVPVEITRVLPHAHYLGKEMQCYATPPDGQKEWLIWIKDWDFNWQGDYQYKKPVALPAGATLHMRFTYDNSTNNVRNPNHPPREVFHGEQTTDEMASVSFQATTATAQDRQTLSRDYGSFYVQMSRNYYAFLLEQNPADPYANTRLGRILVTEGKQDEAINHFRNALKEDSTYAKAHYELGYVYLLRNRMNDAFESFQNALRYNPDDYQACGNLGFICLKTGRLDEAKQYFATALSLNPEDEIARRNLLMLQNAPPPATGH